jgi:ssDNA-binding Zn-finger/Zn-ribbon topoisomerase 1
MKNVFISNAIGGVKLQVRENDLNHALEIMKEAGYTKENDLQLPQELSRLNKPAENKQISMKGEKIICPNCGSEEVLKSNKAGLFFLVTSLLFTFPTPFLQSAYYCFDCKQEFKRKRKCVR